MRPPAAILNPSPPLSRWKVWVGSFRSLMMQAPVPLGRDEQYSPPHMPVIPMGRAVYRPVERFDDGANGLAFDSGRLTSNPLGAGVTYTGGLPVFPSAVAQVVNNTMIFWRSQMVNGGLAPIFGPLYTPDQLASIMPTLTQEAALPPQNPNPPNF